MCLLDTQEKIYKTLSPDKFKNLSSFCFKEIANYLFDKKFVREY